MPSKSYEYAMIRVVPLVERQEFINVGILLACQSLRYLEARIELDPERLRAFAPKLDLQLVQDYLEIIPQICRGQGQLGQLPQRERFHWLVAPRSTIIQLSPIHSGFCQKPEEALEDLLNKLVRQPDGEHPQP
jgi:hypothetical protein